MTTTSTYAVWVSWLEAFRRGENPPADRLRPISADLGSYVEARLLDRVAAAFAERVRHWQTSLGAQVVARPPAAPSEAADMLDRAVAGLDPLDRLAASPLVPASLGASMHTVLAEVRDGARSALDDAWRRQAEETGEETGSAVEDPVPATSALPRPRGAIRVERGAPRTRSVIRG